MNTCTRRFLLRLMVGVLTFAIGVGAAILFGGFTPFRTYASWSLNGYGNRGCHSHPRLFADEVPGAMPATILLKGPRGIRIETELRELPTTPPVAELPVAPAKPNTKSARR